jgi:metal-responsive CopG/Arc/MetJ family transcriptional regulator
MVKVTVTLDENTITQLNDTARRLSKPKSEVVREAIGEYYTKSDRLTEAERVRIVGLLKEYARLPPTRSSAETDRELREIRAARRRGWGRLGAR